MNTSRQVKNQYSNSNKLEARIELHKRFSTNEIGWATWTFQQFNFKEGYKVLELGSGTGSFWVSNQDYLPTMNIFITDLSAGMLQKSRQNISKVNNEFTFNIVDAQEIPYDDNSFDIIMANHMIYHIPSIEKAIQEIVRVLKPGGKLYATTLGKDNMIELYNLLQNYDNNIKFSGNELIDRFGLESGKNILNKYFNHVECRRYKDSLNITEVDPLVNYIASLDGFGNFESIIKEERKNDFRDYLNSLIEDKGRIFIRKDSGILIAAKEKESSDNPVT